MGSGGWVSGCPAVDGGGAAEVEMAKEVVGAVGEGVDAVAFRGRVDGGDVALEERTGDGAGEEGKHGGKGKVHGCG